MRTTPTNRERPTGNHRDDGHRHAQKARLAEIARTAAMAGTITETTRERGQTTRDDLIEAGFTQAEIDRLGDAARAHAAHRILGE